MSIHFSRERSQWKGSLFCIMAIAGWISAAPRLSAQQQADLILYNGKILTVDANFSIAPAVAVAGNKIAAVGNDAEVLKLAGPKTTKVDLKGRTVIPGLIDTHTHIHAYATSAYGGDLTPEQLRSFPIDIRAARTKDDILGQIKGEMGKYKFRPGEWIYFATGVYFSGGGTVDQAKIIYDDLDRWELDKVTPNNPIIMTEGIPDDNGLLVNGKAIDILWAKHGDFIKKYGRFWIDGSGRPNGHLEPPATRIVQETMAPHPDPDVIAPIYKRYLDELAATGVTTVSTRLPKYSADAYKWLESHGQMTLRMAYGMEDSFANTPDLGPALQQLAKMVGSGSDKIWLNSVAPSSVDGASTRACTNQKRITAYGAIDRWWPVGQCHTDSEFKGAAGKAAPILGNYFEDWILASGANGLRFANTHVAGDRSVANILGLIERIQKQYGADATKNWAFDHCAFVNPADLPQAASLGVTFSCAPKYVEDNAPNVAKSYGEKVANTFIDPVKSMLDNGAKVVFESDRDIYTWHDLQILLTRKDREGARWGTQEKLDKATTLKTITRWAANYVLKGDQLGSIEPGKLADLAVLDRDYMTTPEEQVEDILPQMTILDGKIIFVTPDFAGQNNLHPVGAIVSTYKDLKAKRNPRQGLSGGGA